MSDTSPVRLTPSGPPETVLPPAPEEAEARLDHARSLPSDQRRQAVSSVVAQWPRFVDGWAELGGLGRDDIESYACFRVGYHRGLDALRGSGWRGSGYVRWSHPTNRGFLRALEGLRAMAGRIGEQEEEERCAVFLRQLDPDWPPRGLA